MKKQNFCSVSPDKILGYDITDACRFHDEAYAKGGSEDKRKIADVLLRLDIAERLPKILKPIAWIYYFAVRTFGGKFFRYK